MIGTEKQIKYAEDIKAEVMPMLLSMRDVIEAAMLTKEEVEDLADVEDAVFWINALKYPDEERVFVFLTKNMLYPKIKKFLNDYENRKGFML